jgi:hypothetical protein
MGAGGGGVWYRRLPNLLISHSLLLYPVLPVLPGCCRCCCLLYCRCPLCRSEFLSQSHCKAGPPELSSTSTIPTPYFSRSALADALPLIACSAAFAMICFHVSSSRVSCISVWTRSYVCFLATLPVRTVLPGRNLPFLSLWGCLSLIYLSNSVGSPLFGRFMLLNHYKYILSQVYTFLIIPLYIFPSFPYISHHIKVYQLASKTTDNITKPTPPALNFSTGTAPVHFYSLLVGFYVW